MIAAVTFPYTIVKTPTAAQIDPLGSHQRFTVSMHNLEFSSEIYKFNFVFVVSSVTFLPEIALFALVARHQQLLHRTHFALTWLLTSLCLILSPRPVLSDVLPYMCVSSFACTCHIFSLGCSSIGFFFFRKIALFVPFSVLVGSVLRFCLSSLASCLFISNQPGSYVDFCPYPCSSTHR